MGKHALTWPALTLTALALLLTACAASYPPSSPPSVAPPAVPSLPPQALQPNPPSICSQGCSVGVEKLLSSWRDSLTQPMRPGSPASGQPAH